MESFDLPTLDRLHLVPGLWESVCLGAEALAEFPSLDILPHTARLGFHGNKSMVVHIQNPHENRKVEDIAKEIVGKRTFIGWPFLQEGLVAAVSDSLFKYEKLVVVPDTPAKVGLSDWKGKAERVKSV
ncbi:hypothetical protein BDR05DRAFT_1016568 [Suillus weaverae]|nr:hypothetical protein BDR05DRAFT_1016568 [Suillus weaverae]